MKKSLAFAMSLMMGLAVVMSGCAKNSQNRTVTRAFDESVLDLKLRSKFMKDKSVPSNRIRIDIERDVVTLQGRLQNQDQINRAIEIAEQQQGVAEVKSYLVLEDSPEGKESFLARITKPKTKTSGSSETITVATKSKSGRKRVDAIAEKDLLAPAVDTHSSVRPADSNSGQGVAIQKRPVQQSEADAYQEFMND